MKTRFTIKELEEFSDEEMMRICVMDRQSTTTNVYSPLNKRLNKIYGRLRRFNNTNDFLVGFQAVMEIIRNKTSLKGDECMKVERLVKEALKNPKIRI